MNSPWAYNFDFLADVLCKVSKRFKRVATDRSLWEGYVVINADKSPEKVEFVVQECLNNDTEEFLVSGDLAEFFPVMNSPRYAQYINPTIKFHNLRLDKIRPDYISWMDIRVGDALYDLELRKTVCRGKCCPKFGW